MNSQVSETTKRLRELIDNSGKTKKDIAASEALQNCDVSTITKHYNGDREVNSDFIVRYAKYFGVSTDYLLGLSDAATSDKDVQFICDYTGLSEKSVDILHLIFDDILKADYSYIDTLNLLVEGLDYKRDNHHNVSLKSDSVLDSLSKWLYLEKMISSEKGQIVKITSTGMIFNDSDDFYFSEDYINLHSNRPLQIHTVPSFVLVESLLYQQLLRDLQKTKERLEDGD